MENVKTESAIKKEIDKILDLHKGLISREEILIVIPKIPNMPPVNFFKNLFGCQVRVDEDLDGEEILIGIKPKPGTLH